MNNLADTNMMHGSDICYVVYCWNATHDTRKIFKNYGTNQRQAEIDVDALRKHDIDAEIVTVGRE